MDVKSRIYTRVWIWIKIVCEEFLRSNVKIGSVEYEEIGLYLSLNRNETYAKELRLEEYCPNRKTKNGNENHWTW